MKLLHFLIIVFLPVICTGGNVPEILELDEQPDNNTLTKQETTDGHSSMLDQAPLKLSPAFHEFSSNQPGEQTPGTRGNNSTGLNLVNVSGEPIRVKEGNNGEDLIGGDEIGKETIDNETNYDYDLGTEISNEEGETGEVLNDTTEGRDERTRNYEAESSLEETEVLNDATNDNESLVEIEIDLDLSCENVTSFYDDVEEVLDVVLAEEVQPADDQVTKDFFNRFLEDFADVQKTGYPLLGIGPVDPFTPDIIPAYVNLPETLDVLFQFFDPTLTGQASEVTIDSINVEGDFENGHYVVEVRDEIVDPIRFTSSFTVFGYAEADDINASGNLTFDIMDHMGPTRFNFSSKEGDAILNCTGVADSHVFRDGAWKVEFDSNVPVATKRILRRNEFGIQEELYKKIYSTYVEAEERLMRKYTEENQYSVIDITTPLK